MRFFIFFIFLSFYTFSFSSEKSYDLEKDAIVIYNKIIICLKQDHIKNGLEPLKSNRVFNYINIGTFIAFNDLDENYSILKNRLDENTNIKIKGNKNYLLSIYTCYNLANNFIYDNSDLLKLKIEIDILSKKYILSSKSNNKVKKSAIKISNKIIQYSNLDGFGKIKSLDTYFYLKESQYWKPTPDDFKDAAEPNWGKLKMFFPEFIVTNYLPIIYDETLNSQYFFELNKLYTFSNNIDSQKILIAKYWDDNPDQNIIFGHENNYRRRINPALHWILIANSFQIKNNTEYSKLIFTNTVLTMSLFDGLVYCWKMKYKYSTVRPVTVINKILDVNWKPLIVTPPHPEFPSGHSIISTISAEILTRIYGKDINFTDNSLVYFGMPERTFKSFDSAANEATISRFYGGIHYEYTLEKSRLIGVEYVNNIFKFLKYE